MPQTPAVQGLPMRADYTVTASFAASTSYAKLSIASVKVRPVSSARLTSWLAASTCASSMRRLASSSASSSPIVACRRVAPSKR